MKVVLLKDVKGVGRAHEVVEAKDGHALNLLIPKRMAIPATLGALREAELRQKQAAVKRELDRKLVEERIAALAEGRVVICKKVNEQGHLYDAVDIKDIAEAAQLPEGVIRLEKPIKETGTYNIPISSGEVFGTIAISIEAESR
ncbi:50S ribosomal protein L9 [Candidatus Kaiserbacteria bacterium RIFCSPHIGHO2_12_FULL_56_13]|uniref:Large ribosomal subunit protein bL9 n=2 Tax=Candidatus Kaiseribacteriota TaxID=1752734 RepID=A0A1F6E420_9BACT|nr:MAG: 50S ribosomal protein L9 [Candidatus Kaiserbacteria bacterium RIFCSPHIGHO2_02_FULL_56_30]OGG72138.1 MAG: 50S ribosomal protein L9 [Candidatus Kaiserbacteria bacterium RIFCSPHIGHO2_12_FULL_56_13]